jgi:hypothetical protein
MKRLDTARLTEASLFVSRLRRRNDLFEDNENIAEIFSKVKVFEAVVWFPRLQAQVNGTRARGMSTTFRGIKLMTWCCAGRCLIQMERDGHRLTLITGDDEPPWRRDMARVAPDMGPMGVQDIDADPVEAMKMLYECTRYSAELNLTPDDKVTLG